VKANRVAGAGGRLSATSPTLVPKARASGNSGSGRTLMVKYTLIAAATVAAAVTFGGCGGGNDQTLPPTTTTSAATSPSAPTSTPPAWQSKYTPAQIKTYNAALKRWNEYWTKSNQIYAEGVDTPGAEQVFKDYTAISPSLINKLKTYYQQGIRITTPPNALWTRPLAIRGATYVKFEQCTDYSGEKAVQNGKPAKLAVKHKVTPVTVEIEKPAGHDWTIFSMTVKDQKSCARQQ